MFSFPVCVVVFVQYFREYPINSRCSVFTWLPIYLHYVFSWISFSVFSWVFSCLCSVFCVYPIVRIHSVFSLLSVCPFQSFRGCTVSRVHCFRECPVGVHRGCSVVLFSFLVGVQLSFFSVFMGVQLSLFNVFVGVQLSLFCAFVGVPFPFVVYSWLSNCPCSVFSWVSRFIDLSDVMYFAVCKL